jgi:transcriptional regulator with GAF, ATPase, and Fis domain
MARENVPCLALLPRNGSVPAGPENQVDQSWLPAPTLDRRHALSGTLAAHEKALIEDALRASGGRVSGPTGAAARLGMPGSTLESKIRALRINKGRFRARLTKTR